MMQFCVQTALLCFFNLRLEGFGMHVCQHGDYILYVAEGFALLDKAGACMQGQWH
jgi:hypothetical protein